MRLQHAKMGQLSFLLLVLSSVLTVGWSVTINRVQTLDDDFHVRWSADLDAEKIEFEVTVRTLGFVGFGISPQGGMNHADVIIGGVKDDGQAYFADRYASGKVEPKIDDQQDWHLLEARENSTHTVLRFNRALNTCDEAGDIPINNDTIRFIWSIGATDDIRYHQRRGASAVNILDPAGPDYDVSKFDVWHINVNTTYPHADTSYWCSIHKSPVRYTTKRHIVGFRVKMDNELSLTHNHHMILHSCRPSYNGRNLTDYYESFLTKPGGECYEDDGNGMFDLANHCRTEMYVWAKGGDPLFLPENVGIPLNEEGLEEYFMLEVHFDNPNVNPGVQYDTGMEVYTTTEIREHDAGILVIGNDYMFTLMIPPASPAFTIVGHCSPECTKSQFPPEGITMFNVLLHSHLAGRQLKLRHFRDDVELPWISYDNHYDFNYQQNRMLIEPRKVLPGDQLAYECVDASTHLNPPAAVLGGLSTKQEMCDGIVMYYPKMKNLDVCSSTFMDLDYLFRTFGIEDIDLSDPRDPIVKSPPEMAGKTYSEVISTMVDWTDQLRRDIQYMTRFQPHLSSCMAFNNLTIPGVAANRPTEDGPISYPDPYIPYIPEPDNCRK